MLARIAEKKTFFCYLSLIHSNCVSDLLLSFFSPSLLEKMDQLANLAIDVSMIKLSLSVILHIKKVLVHQVALQPAFAKQYYL